MLRYENMIPVEDYLRLRASVGWKTIAYKQAENAVKNCFYSVCCYDDSKVVGMTRLLWNGDYCAYISDVVVDEAYRGQGIASHMINMVSNHLRAETTLLTQNQSMSPPKILKGILYIQTVLFLSLYQKQAAYIYLLLFVIAITITVTIAFADYSVVDKDRHLFKAFFFINTVCVLDIGFCGVVRTTYIDCGITNT